VALGGEREADRLDQRAVLRGVTEKNPHGLRCLRQSCRVARYGIFRRLGVSWFAGCA
jgi:hypothetical protein